MNIKSLLKLALILCFVYNTGCKKTEDKVPEKAAPVVQETNFDTTKGWKLLQTVRYDGNGFDINGVSTIGFYDLDYMNNNLRVLYYQGLQSQQSFLYSNTRIDEFGPDHKIAKREELTWAGGLQSSYKNSVFFLRNYKACWLYDYYNYFYVDGTNQPAPNKNPSGSPFTSYDDNNVFDTYLDVWGYPTGTFFNIANWYHNGAWEPASSRPNGSFKHPSKHKGIATDIINNNPHIVFGGNFDSNDSSLIVAFRYDVTQNKWINAFEKHFPIHFPVKDYNLQACKYYHNNGKPLVVIVSNSTTDSKINFVMYRMDFDNNSLTKVTDVTLTSGYNSLVVDNEIIYLAITSTSATSVVKLEGGTSTPIGMAGLTKTPSPIELRVYNHKLYAITNGLFSKKYGELYIATPY